MGGHYVSFPPINITPTERVTRSSSKQNLQVPPVSTVTTNHVTTTNTNNDVSDVNSLATCSRLHTNSEEVTWSSSDKMMTDMTRIKLQYKTRPSYRWISSASIHKPHLA